MVLTKKAIKRCFTFPPRLTSASALPGETGNRKIVPLHLNAVSSFANKHKVSLGQCSQLKFHYQNYRQYYVSVKAFSALTLLVGRQEGHQAYKKLEWWGTGVVICLERCADLHMAQLPLTVSCFSKIQIGFTFLVPAHPGSPGQRAIKRVCVCVMRCWCGSVWSKVQIVCKWSSWCHCHPHHLLPHLNPDWLYLSGTGLPRLSWKRGR